MQNPLVTINILSYNRKEELRNTLAKVFGQDYKNIEVIVVDNASSDGSPEMVKREFPQVKLIELEKNIGIAGWNKGFEAAHGEYVLVLDDDSYPENGAIEKGGKILSSDEHTAVVGFQVYNTYYNLIENNQEYIESNGKVIETLGFIGCGALIKKSVFLGLGGFESNIFLYYNELEFSIRAINAGYKILFLPDSRIIHVYSGKARKRNGNEKLFINERRFVETFKSYFLFLFLHFDFIYFTKYSAKLILSKFYIALKLGYYLSFFKTLFLLPNLACKTRTKRKPVKKEIQKMYNYGNLKFKDLYVYYPN